MYSRGCYKITVFSYEVTARFLHSNPNCYNPETKDGEGICHEYDQDDRRIKILYPNGVIERIKYDAKGNIIKKIRPEQYDKKTNGGSKYIYKYDCVDRRVQITDLEGNVVQRYVCDSKQYHYDLDKSLTGLCIRTGDSILVNNHYRYDGNGNRTYKKQSGGDTTYQFDALDQLVKVEYPTYSEELFYDRARNRAGRIKDGREERYQYEPRNRLISLTREGVTTPY